MLQLLGRVIMILLLLPWSPVLRVWLSPSGLVWGQRPLLSLWPKQHLSGPWLPFKEPQCLEMVALLFGCPRPWARTELFPGIYLRPLPSAAATSLLFVADPRCS